MFRIFLFHHTILHFESHMYKNNYLTKIERTLEVTVEMKQFVVKIIYIRTSQVPVYLLIQCFHKNKHVHYKFIPRQFRKSFKTREAVTRTMYLHLLLSTFYTQVLNSFSYFLMHPQFLEMLLKCQQSEKRYYRDG